jgi:hypothetical protein
MLTFLTNLPSCIGQFLPQTRKSPCQSYLLAESSWWTLKLRCTKVSKEGPSRTTPTVTMIPQSRKYSTTLFHKGCRTVKSGSPLPLLIRKDGIVVEVTMRQLLSDGKLPIPTFLLLATFNLPSPHSPSILRILSLVILHKGPPGQRILTYHQIETSQLLSTGALGGRRQTFLHQKPPLREIKN